MKMIRWGMIGCGDVAEVNRGPGFYKARNSMIEACRAARTAWVMDQILDELRAASR